MINKRMGEKQKMKEKYLDFLHFFITSATAAYQLLFIVW